MISRAPRPRGGPMLRAALAACTAACIGPWPGGLVDTDTDVVLDTDPVVSVVPARITSDTVLTADRTWRLEEVVFVEGQATLTINAGARIEGDEGSALIITRDATLVARGRADAPIVFTSSAPVGEREPGDWGGVALLGDAPVNLPGARLEGIPTSDTRGAYGGESRAESCGQLEYVEIQFAGFELFQGNELNGLTLAGCGSDTLVRNVHVHRTLDDGVEVFGGTVDLRNVLITRPGDDGLGWDLGWRGRAQYLAIVLDDELGDNAIEADNRSTAPAATPLSRPTIYNATLVGAVDPTDQRGILLQAGTAGELRNFIVASFPTVAIDLQSTETLTFAATESEALSVGPIIAWDIGPSGRQWGPPGDDGDIPAVDESSWLETLSEDFLGVDPRLPVEVFDLTGPRLAPAFESPAASGGALPPSGGWFDRDATYFGAVRPGDTAPWTEGWQTFPED